MENRTALWALTERGAELAFKMKGQRPWDVYLPAKMKACEDGPFFFEKFGTKVSELFHKYQGHIFIMSTGIVVRVIASLLKHKTVDPAVVVMDESGEYSISLISGHIGGANKLAKEAARLSGGRPVITTATDVNNLPAIDLIAKEEGLGISNPGAIKAVNMAILRGESIFVYDPGGYLGKYMQNFKGKALASPEKKSGIIVTDENIGFSGNALILRPGSLVAGVGCNRNTGAGEIKELLFKTLEMHGLSVESLKFLATIDIKSDEKGILELGEDLGLDILFFNREELNGVKTVQRPSAMAKKHLGVNSVCEAAAICGGKNGVLIAPKEKSKNATVAIARI